MSRRSDKVARRKKRHSKTKRTTLVERISAQRADTRKERDTQIQEMMKKE